MINESKEVVNSFVCELNFIRGKECCPTGDTFLLEVCKTMPRHISKNLFQKLFVDGIQLITKLKSNMKGALMGVSDRVLLRKRAIIESVNDELKNIAQIEHSKHRSVCNFAANLLGAVAAYCYFPKKPSIQVVRVLDNQLTLF